MRQHAEYAAAVCSGHHTSAIKLLDAAIQQQQQAGGDAAQQNPDARARLSTLVVSRGICNARMQLYRKALKDFDEALTLQPGSVGALYHKGVVLVGLKRIKDALSTWHSALDHVAVGTDIALILAIDAAIKDPHSVILAVDACSYVWWRVTRPWVLLLCTLCFLGLARTLLHHTHQVAPGVVAAGIAHFSATATVSAPRAPPPTLKEAAPGTVAPLGTPTLQQSPPQGGATPSQQQYMSESSSRTAQQQQQQPAAAPSTPPPQKPAAAGQAGPPAGSNQPPLGADPTAYASRAGKATKAGNSSSSSSSSTRQGGGGADTGTTQAAAGPAQAERAVGPATKQRAAQGKAQPPMEAAQQSSPIAIQLAISQINAGRIQEAEALLDTVLAANPRELGALVARGTARALHRKLEEAVADFSEAIEVEPRYADTWKRRGQARSALGQNPEALADLQKAIDLLPTWGADTAISRAECHMERGLIHQKARDYRRAAKELARAVELDPSNHQAWNLLGLARTSQGELADGVAAYERAVELKPGLKEAWFNMMQVHKEAGNVQKAEAAYAKLQALEESGHVHLAALKILAQMRQLSGEHQAAVAHLDKALPAATDETAVELLFLRAICHHALGRLRDAVRDYEACLTWAPLRGPHGAPPNPKPIAEEVRTWQYLSFYQKELALYLYRSLDRRADSFCPDAEIDPYFKEAWCKKAPLTPDLIAAYAPQPGLPMRGGASSPRGPPGPSPSALQPLVALADRLGALLQNRHQGFMRNVRQQRAAGLAAIELAQLVRRMVEGRRAGTAAWVPSAGSSVHRGAAGRHQAGWRDAMDVVVKWRQLSEPNDQVLWVDLLTQREFEQGFGSHTPIFSGQTKCVRYYMNFERALELQKQVLLKEGHAFDAQNHTVPVGSPAQQDAIRAARTAEDMYAVLAVDSWVVVPIASMIHPDTTLEGTRLTLVKVPNQPDAYEFSIRTPVTPPRWRAFDAELEAAWDAVLAALAAEPLNAPAAAQAILTFAYYWYNFMPLARGTAACGYTTLLSLFWAAGMPVTAHIPPGTQVDWEAILAQRPQQFADAVAGWLLPAAAREGASAAVQGAAGAESWPDVATLPSVQELLSTLRHRIHALNPPGVVPG